MKKIHLICLTWGVSAITGVVSSIFDLMYFGFLSIVFGMAAAVVTSIYFIERWDDME